jgi:hypothetical protein
MIELIDQLETLANTAPAWSAALTALAISAVAGGEYLDA